MPDIESALRTVVDFIGATDPQGAFSASDLKRRVPELGAFEDAEINRHLRRHHARYGLRPSGMGADCWRMGYAPSEFRRRFMGQPR